jgi:hypothetical protein
MSGVSNKSIYMLGAIALVATMALVSWPISTVTYVSAEKPKNPDLWGKEASELAQANKGEKDGSPGSEMGEHTRDSDLNGDDPGRVGVGNIDEALPGDQEDHPSGVVDFLCGEAPNDPAPDCPDAIADDDP